MLKEMDSSTLEMIQEIISQSPELTQILEQLTYVKEVMTHLKTRLQAVSQADPILAEGTPLFVVLGEEIRSVSLEKMDLDKQIQNLPDQESPVIDYFWKLLGELSWLEFLKSSQKPKMDSSTLETIREKIAQSPELTHIQKRLTNLKDRKANLVARLQTISQSPHLKAEHAPLYGAHGKVRRSMHRERMDIYERIQKLLDQDGLVVRHFQQLLDETLC
ncbi:MAG: hypothetical protein ACE5OZ_18340 [Candidatus Heimdallarchaeota archaeon]